MNVCSFAFFGSQHLTRITENNYVHFGLANKCCFLVVVVLRMQLQPLFVIKSTLVVNC